MLERIAALSMHGSAEEVERQIEEFRVQPYVRRPSECLARDRLMYLGRTSEPTFDRDELTHLRACEPCGDYLAAIRSLTMLPTMDVLTTPVFVSRHIPELRLEELRARRLRPNKEEQAHIAQCDGCRSVISSRTTLEELLQLLHRLGLRRRNSPRPGPSRG